MHAVDPGKSSEPEESAPNVASFEDLAQDTSAYLRAWAALLASETRLAGTSVVRLVLAALVIPALVLVICIIVNSLLVSMINRWLLDWPSSIAVALLLNLAALGALLFVMRRWWRNLSLPRSRGALKHLLQRNS